MVESLRRDDVEATVTRLRDSGARVYLACSGAGAGLQDLLWRVPGISQTLVGSVFPYAQQDFCDFLGFTPEKYCSPEAAVDLAAEAYYRCYVPGRVNIGLGLTAVVATKEMHRGAHRVFCATITEKECRLYQYEFEKGGPERRKPDGLFCDHLGLQSLAWAAGIDGGYLEVGQPYWPSALRQNILDRIFLTRPFVDRHHNKAELPTEFSLFPGAFNPPHEGHLGMAKAVEQAHGLPVVFNITVNPPHKDPLTPPEILARQKLLRGHNVLISRDDPFYLHKARLHPDCNIVIGADALIRMLDQKWYADGQTVESTLDEFKALGTTFLVFDRMIDGKLVGLEDIKIPEEHLYSFVAIDGRWDISSTQLRST